MLLAVETTTADHDTAVDILDDEGTIDMDEREDTWRASGWAGRGDDVLTEGSTESAVSAQAARPAPISASPARARQRISAMPTSPRTAGMSGSVMPRTATLGDVGKVDDTLSRGSDTSSSEAGFAGGTSGTDRTGMAGSEEVIPVVEELRVGKRDVNLGRVRVRSYVREVPAEAQVNLREEHVRIERRPVDRPADAGDALFRDRTIDMEEHAEEAVVSKEPA